MRVFDIVQKLTDARGPGAFPVGRIDAAFADELMAAWFARTPLLTTGTLEILLRTGPRHQRAAEELGYGSRSRRRVRAW